MKSLLLPFLAIFLISFTARSQKKCRKFKTGTFQNVENGEVNSLIIRNDSIQYEKVERLEVSLKIDWIDDCNYRLSFIDGNEAFWANRPKDAPTPDTLVEILDVDGNSYTQKSRSDIEGDDFIYISKMVKVE